MANSVVSIATQIKIANEITTSIVALSQLVNGVGGIRTVVASVSDNLTIVALQAMPTAPFDPQGNLGTADGTPVSGNPIDTRVVTAAPFQEVQSSFNYNAAFNLLEQLLNLVNGAAVTQQSTAPNIIALFAP